MAPFEFFFWSRKDYEALMGALNQIIALQQQILSRQQQYVNQVLKQEQKVMSALDDLKTQVQENTNLERSAIALIEGIAKQLADAIEEGDTEAIAELSQQLKTSATGLAAAIAANTPQAPT
jgi:translation elongation factor EF-Ts